MIEHLSCPRCGRPLPADAPGGVCPACAYEVALNLAPEPACRSPSRRAPLRRKRLLHYRLIAKIGEGGMGIVYKAHDERLERTVAIKVLPSDMVSDPARRHRFIREAKAASALNHPSIVTIHEVAASGGVHFIVMEYIEGRTLDQLVGTSGLPSEQVLLYAIPIAGALARAHETGIVHRDLKPQNIMVRDDGIVKLLDFGLAKLVETAPQDGPAAHRPSREASARQAAAGYDSDVALPMRAGSSETVSTLATHIAGTPGFMAPEQIEGHKIDGRADIFAFGAVLYHALSGRRPFARGTADATITAILREDPPPLQEAPAWLAAVVARCLNKNPADRFPTATELQAALRTAALEPVAERPDPSVAVLPFANLGGRPEDDYFGDALSGEIITALARIPNLKVTGRTSSLVVTAARLEPREIGARLGVAHILEGGVDRTPSSLHVAARLVRAADGQCLWAETYDGTPAEIFSIQGRVAKSVVARLGIRLQPQPGRSSQTTENLEAYHHFLLGKRAFDWGDLATAKDHLDQAARLDPRFAPAHDALAEVWWHFALWGIVPGQQAIAQGIWHALHALEIDDHLADTHALVAQYRALADFDWSETNRSFARARELDPGSPKVRFRHGITGLYIHGRVTEALAEFEAVLQTDPLASYVRAWVASTLGCLRDYESAIELSRAIVDQKPVHPMGYQELAIASSCVGRHDDAVKAAQGHVESTRRLPVTLGLFGWTCARAGRLDEAGQVLAELNARVGDGYVSPSSQALVYIGLGELDDAVTWISRAIDVRDPLVVALKVWPPFDPIRAHPHYPALLRKMNMEP